MSKLEQFYFKLKPKERSFFLYEVPQLITNWFDGYFMDSTDTAKLPLFAKSYKEVDSLAVALLHLRPLYPPKTPRVLRRLESTRELPSSNPLVYPSKYRLLTSWTTQDLGHQHIRALRSYKDKGIVLEWKNPGQQILASYESLSRLCSDAIALFNLHGEGANCWQGAYSSIYVQWEQQEYLCYLKVNQKFTWALYED